jgi:hypothetical protein
VVVERPKAELERLAQQIERSHPEWSAREVEAELDRLAPVAYGRWREDTPNGPARLRQVQRWRTGFRSPRKPLVHLPFRYLWPLGERQRQALEPSFPAASRSARASHRVFLQNCGEETLRELRAHVGDREVAYEPVLRPMQFAEVAWTRNEDVMAAALAARSRETLRFRLTVEFAVSNGARRARLDGELLLDPDEGWTGFLSSDGQSKEIE